MYATPVEERPAKFVSICQNPESWCQILVNLIFRFIMKIPLLCVYQKLATEIALVHDVWFCERRMYFERSNFEIILRLDAEDR